VFPDGSLSVHSQPSPRARPINDDIEHTSAQQRHVSVPIAPSSVPVDLIDLPTRSASLGCVVNSTSLPTKPSITVPKLAPHVAGSPKDKMDFRRGLAKEKTKSKVWGIFLGGRANKDKVIEEDWVIRPAREIKPRASGELVSAILPLANNDKCPILWDIRLTAKQPSWTSIQLHPPMRPVIPPQYKSVPLVQRVFDRRHYMFPDLPAGFHLCRVPHPTNILNLTLIPLHLPEAPVNMLSHPLILLGKIMQWRTVWPELSPSVERPVQSFQTKVFPSERV
jgi:hypothetical protein